MMMGQRPPMFWNQAELGRARWEARSILEKHPDVPWKPMAVFETLLWPALLFSNMYYWEFAETRYYDWKRAMVCGPVLSSILCILLTWTTRLYFRYHLPCRKLMVLSVCMWFAWAAGWYLGDCNFAENKVSFITYNDLATYTDIDPAMDKGQTYMDAGQVYFREGSTVDRRQMVAYRSGQTFCAAPIVGSPTRNQQGKAQAELEGPIAIPQSGTVDFWAVGVDCCNQATRTFTCGQAANPSARAGMRLIRDDQRPFFLLAVQEWTARVCPVSGGDNTAAGYTKSAPLVCLPARHPLFFTWVEDPVADVDAFYLKSTGQFGKDIAVFLLFDLIVSLGLLYGLQMMGFH
eukprot:TRINITY_DN110577_c0_g1_i1.p1 TRINITY_DN110577_c0_g1~~TRINITY_DN110577_c0_g1_i1.p1  ORF type:complete len:347 (-),score=69.69 TRINITY_DN110577_c0_g1_i1:184-1224(-)